MSLDELRDKGHGGVDSAKEAFDELCAMVENLNVSSFEFLLVLKLISNFPWHKFFV